MSTKEGRRGGENEVRYRCLGLMEADGNVVFRKRVEKQIQDLQKESESKKMEVG